MRTIILAFINLIATMQISHQQEVDRGTQSDDDRGLNPYPVIPTNNCQSLPNFFSPDAVKSLNTKYGCPFKLICAESINKDVSRSRLYQFFRMQSAQFVNGTCPFCTEDHFLYHSRNHYSNIFLMRQNWYLEYSAYHFFAKYRCPFEKSVKLDASDFPDFANHNLGTLPDMGACDHFFAVTSMRIDPKEKQEEAVADFIQVMSDAKDLLQTWNDSDYALGSASHYGCAVIIKDEVNGTSGLGETLLNERVAYLACLFVAYDALVSHKGNLDDYSCDRSYGLAEYFDSVNATLCVHINLELNPDGVPFDIACEEKYDATMCLDPSTTPQPTKPSTVSTSTSMKMEKLVMPNSTPRQTQTSGLKTERWKIKPIRIVQPLYEDSVDDYYLSGLAFFMLMAVVAFIVLVLTISIHRQTR